MIQWTLVCKAPLSMAFPRQEYWSELPFPSPGDLPDPGIDPTSPALAGRFLFLTTERLRKPTFTSTLSQPPFLLQCAAVMRLIHYTKTTLEKSHRHRKIEKESPFFKKVRHYIYIKSTDLSVQFHKYWQIYKPQSSHRPLSSPCKFPSD